jgi:hypothetical protein
LDHGFPSDDRDRGGLLRHRIGVLLTATLLLSVVVLLPFLFSSVSREMIGNPDGETYALTPRDEPAPTHSRLHVAVAALDEQQRLVSLRVSGHHLCATACPWSDRILFLSLYDEEDDEAEGLPPSAAVTLPATNVDFTDTIQLPVRGHPLRYPFDSYQLTLAVVLQRVLPDGTIQTLAPAEARGHLFLSIRERLPRLDMDPPVPVDPATVQPTGLPLQYLLVDSIAFQRPLYLQALSILLVLLISAAAAYAVFIGPLHDLLINCGTVVLGVWGIRSILTPSGQTAVTALDVSLAMVIVFLLGAIAVRTLRFSQQRSGMRLRPPRARR